jgi:hypothetical protein
VLQLVTRGANKYIIGLPIDTPIVLVEDEDMAIERDDPRLGAMLPIVDKALTDLGCKMIPSAGVLTIEVSNHRSRNSCLTVMSALHR